MIINIEIQILKIIFTTYMILTVPKSAESGNPYNIVLFIRLDSFQLVMDFFGFLTIRTK